MNDSTTTAVIVLFAIATMIILYSTLDTRGLAKSSQKAAQDTNDTLKTMLIEGEKTRKESEAETDVEYLFYIGSDDNSTVEVKVDESNRQKILVYLPTKSSNITAFTNIPIHESYDLGNLVAADRFFNRNKSNPIDTSCLPAIQKAAIDGLINTQEHAFITQQPNCTLSFTQEGHPISHIDTIAKMTKLENINMSGKEVTVITFIILDGNKLVPQGVYEYVSITVDNFWEKLGAVAASFAAAGTCGGLAVLAGAVTLGTFGAGAGTLALANLGCSAAVVGATAAVGKAWDVQVPESLS